MKKLLIIVMLGLSLSMTPHSNNSLKSKPDLHSIMKVLKRLESKNQKNLSGANGQYIGILQISKICIKEVNIFCGTSYVHKDAYNVKVSEDIFLRLMRRGISLFKAKHKKHPTEEQLVRMWNGGVYNGYNKSSTKKYYAEYLRQKKK